MTTALPPHTEVAALHTRLQHFADRYAVSLPPGRRLVTSPNEAADARVRLVSGEVLMEENTKASEQFVPLPAWRWCRRFQEMHRLLRDGTIHHPVSYRSRHFASRDAAILTGLLYREIDLVRWLSGQAVVSVFATMAGSCAANVLLELADGAAVGIELSAALPPDAEPIDRHEVIARRGVVCDQVVDAITRSPSVRLIHPQAPAQFIDTDFELFGLGEHEAALVRAAMDAARDPALPNRLRAEHEQTAHLVRLALASAERCRRLDATGVPQ